MKKLIFSLIFLFLINSNVYADQLNEILYYEFLLSHELTEILKMSETNDKNLCNIVKTIIRSAAQTVYAKYSILDKKRYSKIENSFNDYFIKPSVKMCEWTIKQNKENYKEIEKYAYKLANQYSKKLSDDLIEVIYKGALK